MFRQFSSIRACGLLAVLGAYSAQACDQPSGKPATSPSPAIVSTTVIRVVEADTLPAPLTQATQKTAEHVKSCHEEVAVQQKIVDEITLRRDQAAEACQLSESILRELGKLLSVPGCSVCVEGKLYRKETIAALIEKKLSVFNEQTTALESIDGELKIARGKLDQLVAKAKRWEAAEKLLLSELDRVLRTKADVAKGGESQQAEQEALQLADAITAKISKAKTEAKADAKAHEPSGSDSSVVSPISSAKTSVPGLVSKAIAEFEAIFGK